MKTTEFCKWLTAVSSLSEPIDYIQINRWAQESGGSTEDWDNFLSYAQGIFNTIETGANRGIVIGGYGNRDITLKPAILSSNFIGGLSI